MRPPLSGRTDGAVVDAGESDPLLVSTVAWPQIRAFLDDALRQQDVIMSDGEASRMGE